MANPQKSKFFWHFKAQYCKTSLYVAYFLTKCEVRLKNKLSVALSRIFLLTLASRFILKYATQERFSLTLSLGDVFFNVLLSWPTKNKSLK
jgi:hypothetical protein